LKIFENELIRVLFASKIENVGGASRKLHNKELNSSVVKEAEGGGVSEGYCCQ
jgi:hypothetical protein